MEFSSCAATCALLSRRASRCTCRAGSVTIFGLFSLRSFRVRMKNCVIFVKRCLLLCTRNLDQCCNKPSTCFKALA
jgi:hypothetical protein